MHPHTPKQARAAGLTPASSCSLGCEGERRGGGGGGRKGGGGDLCAAAVHGRRQREVPELQRRQVP
eukprot:260284-Rhodomonas_salina.1